jgi:tetratricopeptide (TPR) repeat protein
MIEPLEAALRLDSELPQAHLNLAYAYQLVGRYDAALEHVHWFLERYPQSAAGHRILALVERGRGRHEDALAEIRRARELQPQNLEAALIEGELLLFLHRAGEAYARLDELAPHVGADRRFLTLQLRAAVLSGLGDEAKALQARLSRLDPSVP